MRRKHYRRNPVAALGTLKEWTQGVDSMQVVGGLMGLGGSLALASLLKPGDPVTPSWSYKAGKMLLTAGGMLVAGSLGKSLFGEKAGQAAFIGGISALGVQALQLFSGIKIGQLWEVLPAGPESKEKVNMISP